MTDVFIAEVRRSLRAALFQKLRPYGLSQDDVTQLVAAATTSAMAVADFPPWLTPPPWPPRWPRRSAPSRRTTPP
ncbi:hypothetical protein [Brevundimonas sp. Leaf168]|uniref:hypothetical protein n=1 Tax=Brevundimonas sp. Leaf168 TaxID=1736283 RepID=UPI0006F294ED|nr:hypothetical protein [Brevundimonas sp. Leaf168]KQR52981.1 hypothetical protein ASF81_12035 [Brevundimonas sp. Leaf168]